MRNNLKKYIICALAVVLLMPIGSATAYSNDGGTSSEKNTSDNTSIENTDNDNSGSDTDEEALPDKITDEQALTACKMYAENDNFILYGNEEDDRICLYVKSTGKCWWTTPINALADDTILDSVENTGMKNAQRLQISSGLVLTYADLRQEKRNQVDLYSASKSSIKWKESSNGIKITYQFTSCKITVPVVYTLEDKGLRVSIETKDIIEKNTSNIDGKVTTSIAIAPQFGSAPATDVQGKAVEGYMIVPDGSGAVINYNNDKSGYPVYSQKLYGRDYTTVPILAPKVTQQAYLPVVATVSGSDGLVAIAADGDSNAYANAMVSGHNNQTYNTTYFSFELRSSDSYYMSGKQTSMITVYEKGDKIETPKISVLYVPVTADKEVNYADVAKAYRDYLLSDKGLTSKTEENKNNFYVDLYGGVLKKKAILGIPFNVKTSMTSFSEAETIVSELKDNGVEDIVVNYNDWTNKSIKNKISTKLKPSGKLGGKSDFNDMKEAFEDDGVELYPSLSNTTMSSSTWGYWTLTDTAIRVSNSYSRQSEYDIAFGVAKKGVSPALLSPNSYGKVFSQIIGSFDDNDMNGVSFGAFSSVLVSDFAKKNKSSRYETMNTVISGYEDAVDELGGVLTEGANAYVIPYASHITNVPVYSSEFNITDYDIPFYQMVIHGYVPYSTQSINSSSNSLETFLLAMASGSSLHYDMIYEEASEIADTAYAGLYYANYNGWIQQAVAEYRVAESVLSKVSTMTISDYKLSDGVSMTTFSADGKTDVVVVVDMNNATVTVDGVNIDMSGVSLKGGLLS